jgi:hypothetical protein
MNPEEIMLTVTWQTREDGSWEAWLVDEMGAVAQVRHSPTDLAAFLHRACERRAEGVCRFGDGDSAPGEP